MLVVKKHMLAPATLPPSSPGGGSVFYVTEDHQRSHDCSVLCLSSHAYVLINLAFLFCIFPLDTFQIVKKEKRAEHRMYWEISRLG